MHNAERKLFSTMEDGFLRLRITNACNAKCRYCGTNTWPKEAQTASIDKYVLYKQCTPLYEKIKFLLLTGGDPLFAKEGMRFSRFISEKYPHLTLMLETNGLLFNAQWQELAMKNLMKVHVSTNASNAEIYQKGCWSGSVGGAAFKIVEKNTSDYMDLLKNNGLEVFAPDVSMVINKGTAHDIRAFIKKALALGLSHCTFFFDYSENNMNNDFFACPETSRPALEELMKIERVLAKKFFVYFRLWIPLKEVGMLQKHVDAIPIGILREEYSDLLALAANRSMLDEYEKRQDIRKKKGKKTFTFAEEWTPTIHQIDMLGKKVCAAPFKMLDMYPLNMVECCGWIKPRISLDTWTKDNSIDWDALYNSQEMQAARLDMISGECRLCQRCCPLHSQFNEISDPHQYGYDRSDE